jgi:hypothetical protein
VSGSEIIGVPAFPPHSQKDNEKSRERCVLGSTVCWEEWRLQKPTAPRALYAMRADLLADRAIIWHSRSPPRAALYGERRLVPGVRPMHIARRDIPSWNGTIKKVG